MLRAWGADAVGMSMVPEVLASRWAGIRVLALSFITNAVLSALDPLTHQDVLHKVEEESPRLRRFLEKLLEAWPR